MYLVRGKPFTAQIAELISISPVPKGSYEQHPEGIRTYVSSRLHIGYDPINLPVFHLLCLLL